MKICFVLNKNLSLCHALWYIVFFMYSASLNDLIQFILGFYCIYKNRAGLVTDTATRGLLYTLQTTKDDIESPIRLTLNTTEICSILHRDLTFTWNLPLLDTLWTSRSAQDIWKCFFWNFFYIENVVSCFYYVLSAKNSRITHC